MSTENIITKNNLSTNKAIAEFVTSYSLDVLKRARFDVGKRLSTKFLKEAIRIERLSCEDYCSIDEGQREVLREKVIRKAINRITEI